MVEEHRLAIDDSLAVSRQVEEIGAEHSIQEAAGLRPHGNVVNGGSGRIVGVGQGDGAGEIEWGKLSPQRFHDNIRIRGRL
jgi:hypothetical protein